MCPGLPEDWCWRVLRELRWPGRTGCPRCGRSGSTQHRRSGHACLYRCPGCRAIFSDLTETPFEGTRLPLSIWFSVIRLLVLNDPLTPRGLERTFGVDRKTAYKMRDRLCSARENPLIRSIGAMVVSREIESRSGREQEVPGGVDGGRDT
jgi:transposase-like protein